MGKCHRCVQFIFAASLVSDNLYLYCIGGLYNATTVASYIKKHFLHVAITTRDVYIQVEWHPRQGLVIFVDIYICKVLDKVVYIIYTQLIISHKAIIY